MSETKLLKIFELLESNTIMTVKELSEELDCSEMTIRRYLSTLEERNLVQRLHGSAFLKQDARPTKFDEQMKINSREKFLIAHEASRLIKENDIVCFDSGTTTHRMMRLLDDQLKFTAFTPSIPLLMDLGQYTKVKVLTPEGVLNHNNLTIELSKNTLKKNLNADISFISCRSLRLPFGTFEHTDQLIQTKRWLAQQGKKKILLADSSKWQKYSVLSCIPLVDIDIIITDSGVEKDHVKLAEQLGKKVIVVSD